MDAQTKQQQSYSGEYDYLMLLKSSFDRNIFPDEFDKWPVNVQCDWTNRNLRKFFPDVPESLLEFIPAAFRQGVHDRVRTEPPEWYDADKYRKGQQFVQDHLAVNMFTMLFSILPLYTFELSLKGFIMGNHGHTPYLGFQRYLSTVDRIISWYYGEPWVEGTPAYKNMLFTCKLHSLIRSKLNGLTNDAIDAACTFANPWSSDRELLLKDFRKNAACPVEEPWQRPYKLYVKSPHRPKPLSTADLAATQCCFISLILLYPRDFGACNATDDDLDGFCHLWRCYGYFLGMEEEYNFCRGSLDEIKQRTRDFYQYWVVANFKEITPEWEHMTRCIVEPFNYIPMIWVPYKVAVLFAVESIGINMPNLHASLSYSEWIVYKLWRFIFRHLSKLSMVRSLLNRVVFKMYRDALKYGPQKLAKLDEKSKKKVSNFSVIS